jgi:hypothetical protein
MLRGSCRFNPRLAQSLHDHLVDLWGLPSSAADSALGCGSPPSGASGGRGSTVRGVVRADRVGWGDGSPETNEDPS